MSSVNPAPASAGFFMRKNLEIRNFLFIFATVNLNDMGIEVKLSEFIAQLQKSLEQYGDGEVYMLDDFGYHSMFPKVYPKPEYETVWDDELEDTKQVLVGVTYMVDGVLKC